MKDSSQSIQSNLTVNDGQGFAASDETLRAGLEPVPMGLDRPNKIATVQDALRKFAQHIQSEWVFDEASVALDAGHDFRLTIICTEKTNGYLVTMRRQQVERLGDNSFIKLSHGEWKPSPYSAKPPASPGANEKGVEE